VAKGSIEIIMEERAGILRAIQLIVTSIMLPLLAWLSMAVFDLSNAVTKLNENVHNLENTVGKIENKLDRKLDEKVFFAHEEGLKKEHDNMSRRIDSNVQRLDIYGMERRK